jgi:ATP-dependent Clp protease ATP-binding subunit ClpA
MERIVDKLIGELAAQLAPRGVRLELTAAARRRLAERGHDPAFGARPLARLIEDEVKRPLTEELLFGTLESGGSAVIDLALVPAPSRERGGPPAVRGAAEAGGVEPRIVVRTRPPDDL